MEQKQSILVVDDEQVIRKLFTKILRGEECNIVTARDGKEALKKAKKNRFDIIFMDIKMPGESGVQTFKKIKKLQPESQVFMMTAFEVPQEIEKALAEGASGSLFKPFNVSDIVDVVNKRKVPLSRFPVRIDDGMLLLDADEIFYISAKYNGAEIHTERNSFWVRFTLKELENRFTQNYFVRTHRSYIVNLYKVRKVAPLSRATVVLVMDDERQSQVLVSRSRTAQVKEFLGIRGH